MRYGIGIGSSGPRAQAFVDDALRALSSSETMRMLGVSARYATPPAGGVTDAPFVNAAAVVESELSPPALLGWLRALERRCGRVRSVRWGPRSLDLDLLWTAGAPVSRPDLTVPHPRLAERPFALLPLLEALGRAGVPAPAALVTAGRALALAPLRRLDAPEDAT